MRLAPTFRWGSKKTAKPTLPLLARFSGLSEEGGERESLYRIPHLKVGLIS
mgnify:CR=1 FL=1